MSAPLHVTALGWTLTLAAIAGLLALDWWRLGRQPHALSFAEAVRWSAFYIAVAILFGVVFGVVAGWDLGAQYFAGYVVEKSLSVDNLCVFVIIMGAFSVPAALQPKALTVGIVIALGLRALLIALGAALLSAFSFMFLVFGLGLTITGVQLFRHRDQDPSAQSNVLVSAARRVLPIAARYDGPRLMTRLGDRRVFTPLVLVLIAIGTTDVLFAFDSIPAVFGVTNHAYIVFVANAFALLGLRALFFLVARLLGRLVYLSTGLAVILAFIGVKLMLEFGHERSDAIPQLTTGVSLAVVAGVLAVTAAASVIKSRRAPERRAHAGSLRQPSRAPAAERVGPAAPEREETQR
ncbi:MAG TPA: TerC/Alx family metal homeostasis membrane protein [Solirubrobacteraceae bacterium]|nr:TerC/Alx family metal homeostasis membrane protein [Solirubrobacteraceae bacterium]